MSNLNEVYDVLRSTPEPPKANVPESLPPNVETTFREAEATFLAGGYAGSTMLFRKAMERALKLLVPGAKGQLNQRIRAAEKERLFPQAMVDWLNEVRAFGNDAAHEEDWDPTPEDAAATRSFANLFLTYAFTMPARVEAARTARTAKAS